VEPTWHGVSERYDVELAPPGLHLTQALANSFAAKAGRDADPLAELDRAQAFVDELTGQWAESQQQEAAPRLVLSEAELERLRRLRDTVRALLREPGEAGPVNGPDGLEAGVRVVVRRRTAAAVPTGSGAGWVESAVGAELLLAADQGVLRRLKLCRKPTCEVAFYDRSKNNSRVWHDMARCGTPQQMREYRKRKRAEQA
jgi:predicted RNA-binding Zn ribbon-like protein